MIPFDALPISPVLASLTLMMSVISALGTILIAVQMLLKRQKHTVLTRIFTIKVGSFALYTVTILLARVLTLDVENNLSETLGVAPFITRILLISGAALTLGGPTSFHFATVKAGKHLQTRYRIGIWAGYSISAITTALFLLRPQVMVQNFQVWQSRDISFAITPLAFVLIGGLMTFTVLSYWMFWRKNIKGVLFFVISDILLTTAIGVAPVWPSLSETNILVLLMLLSVVALSIYYLRSPDVCYSMRITKEREATIAETKAHVEALETLTDANTQLFAQQERARLRAEIMYNVLMAANQASDLDSLLSTVLNTYYVNTNPKWVMLQLADEKLKKIDNSLAFGPEGILLSDNYDEFCAGLAGQAFLNQVPIMSMPDEADVHEPEVFRAVRVRLGIGSTISAPLVHQGKSLGAITALNSIESDNHSQDDMDLLVAVANQIANSIAAFTADAELRHSEAQFRTLMQHAPDGIILFNTDTKQLVDVNEKAEEMFGIPREVLFKLNVMKAITESEVPGLLKQVVAAIRQTLRHGHYSAEFEYPNSDGRPIPISVNLLRLPGTDNRLIRASVVDLTDRKQAEIAMVQSQKQESLSVMAGGIAHDFNNILLAIMGQSQIIQRRLDEDSKLQKNVTKIQKASQRASELTRQMMAYAGRGQTTDRQALNINALIEENLQLFSATISENVRIKHALQHDLPHIMAEVSQIEQIVINMIINASEAIGDQPGVIQIETGRRTYTEDEMYAWQLLAPDFEAGDYVHITFTDTGSGIDDETLQRIFDPFFTTKASGHGLGLAAALGIIRSHGGSIQVHSNLGQGTQFEIVLPAIDIEKTPTDTFVETDETRLANRTFLLIDDDEIILDTLAETLQSYGIKTLTATSGLAGIDVYNAHREEIDLVLSDVAMPGISGVEAMRRILNSNAHVPFILSSGYNRVDAEKVAQEIENVMFLQKPYRIDQLLALIVSMLPEAAVLLR